MHADEHRLATAAALQSRWLPPNASRRIVRDPFAVLGVEAIARDRTQAVDEAVERVAAHEQAHALALAEPEDPHRDIEQLVGPDLKQRVPRIGLEDLGQRLRVVAVRREAGPLEDGVDLRRAAPGSRAALSL